MTSARIAACAVLALGAYAGAAATDFQVQQVGGTVQAVLDAKTELSFEEIVDLPRGGFVDVLDVPIKLAFLFLFFGGLPLAGLALRLESQRARRHGEQARQQHVVPYACLTFQIVSCTLSALIVVPFVAFLPSEWATLRPRDWCYIAYLGVQLILGIVATPVWRKLVMSGSDVRIFPSMRPTHSISRW